MTESGLNAELLELAYKELRGLAALLLSEERPGHTLQPTALAHEVWLRLGGQDQARYSNKQHFLSVAAHAMRRILVDHARRRLAERRGGGALRVTATFSELSAEGAPDYDVLALEDALEALEALDPRAARIVELRFFAGLSEDEVAELLDVSRSTVTREWRMARAWLAERMAP